MNEISVMYGKNDKLIITCPLNMNDLPKSLPGRVWNANKKAWVVPLNRVVAETIKKWSNKIKCDVETKKAIDHIIDSYERNLNIAKSDEKFPPWYEFKLPPRFIQMKALNKIYGNHATALFMDMRTGKTKVIIDFICALHLENKINKALILCPFSSTVRKNWENEIHKNSPFEVSTHLLDTSKIKSYDRWRESESRLKILIVGTESLAAGSAIKVCSSYLKEARGSFVAIDESHMIKNHSSIRSKNCVSLGQMANFRLIATGTEISRGVEDLYMQFQFLDPNIFGIGNYYSFRNRYCLMGGYKNKEIIGYSKMDELASLTEPYMFTATKKDVFIDVPDTIFIQRSVKPSANQLKLMNDIKSAKSIENDHGSITLKSQLQVLSRLQEVSDGFYSLQNPNIESNQKYVNHVIKGTNPKIDELMELVEELPGQTIIWCAFTTSIRLVTEALRKVYGDTEVVELHGGIDSNQQCINVFDIFQKGKARFIVGNTATGSMGLTMDAAENIIYFSNTFKYTDRRQSQERAFGPHKKKGIVIVDLIVEGSVDELPLKAFAEKQDVSDFVRTSINNIKQYINCP